MIRFPATISGVSQRIRPTTLSVHSLSGVSGSFRECKRNFALFSSSMARGYLVHDGASWRTRCSHVRVIDYARVIIEFRDLRDGTGHVFTYVFTHIHTTANTERYDSRLRLICIRRWTTTRSPRPGSARSFRADAPRKKVHNVGVTVCRADIRVYTHPHRVAGSSNGGSCDLWPQREVARRLIYFTVDGRRPCAIPPSSSRSPLRRAFTLFLLAGSL